MALCTSRRSGGTWLMEMIGAERGVRTLGQPLSIRQHAKSGLNISIPIYDDGQIITPDEDEREQLEQFVSALLRGKVTINAPWRIWRSSFDWKADRLLLKITDALGIIPWLASSMGLTVVYSTRHPIPQSLSCMRLGWGLTAKAYLRNEQFVNRWLTEKQFSHCKDIMGSSRKLDKYVLNWALENMVPLRKNSRDINWSSLSYEEAVLYPRQVVSWLCEVLGLSDEDRLLSTVGRPSKTTETGSAAEEGLRKSRGREWLVARWRDEIGDDSERRVMDILETLEIDRYVAGRVLPRESKMTVRSD